MPEGDTIFRSARALQKALGGKTVTAFETQIATLASVVDSKGLAGRTVEKVEARGKWCLLYFSGDLVLVTHMLMSGSWHIYRTGERWRVPASSVRCQVAVSDFVALAVNVPVMEFHTERTLARYSQVPKLGIDILSESYSTEAGVHAVKEYATRHPEAEVGVTLLNQRVMAGLGNVYKSEVAFAAGVNPFRQLRTLTGRELEVMAEVSGRYMQANVASGSSATGGDAIVTYAGNRRTTHNMNAGERLWVYGRQGQECRRCGALVMMRKQGEQARSTYWCPVCQPWVAAAGQSGDAPEGRMIKLLGKRRRGGC
ncbi:MAG: Fpg/Nei family DNA glycosylase [Rhodospirillales bacterium]|nr:Fpg/Nei family DNA glycosylase [Acetobacter sp.]